MMTICRGKCVGWTMDVWLNYNKYAIGTDVGVP